jgi:hypothetical protein
MTTRQLLLLGASVLPYGCAAPAEAYLLRASRAVGGTGDRSRSTRQLQGGIERRDRGFDRLEPGVLTLFAVSVKDHPNQIRIFETYVDVAAYEAHLDTPHFKKYKTGTQRMVKSLTLVETNPILLGAKTR